uniref:Pecanex-like protein n=1 Tax=Haemonchus contortus TaxID=6289 RepID=A0A7I4XUY7_HAECO
SSSCVNESDGTTPDRRQVVMVPVLSGTWRHLSSRRSIQSGIKDRSHCHVNSRRVSHLRSVFHLQPPAYFLGMYRSAGAIAHQLRSLSHWSSDMCHLPSEWTIQSGIKDVLCPRCTAPSTIMEWLSYTTNQPLVTFQSNISWSGNSQLLAKVAFLSVMATLRHLSSSTRSNGGSRIDRIYAIWSASSRKKVTLLSNHLRPRVLPDHGNSRQTLRELPLIEMVMAVVAKR